MTAVQTCTVVAPRSRNSAASRQLETPPIPDIGILISRSLAIDETIFNAIGFTAGPQYPPCAERPPTLGRGVNVSRSMPVMELMVLMAESASAWPRLAARAAARMSVILGVSFTITGVRATSLTHPVIMQAY